MGADGDALKPQLEDIELHLRPCVESPLSTSPGSKDRAELEKSKHVAAGRRPSRYRRASVRSKAEVGTRNMELKDVVDVAAGWTHAVCVTGNSQVLSVGRGFLGYAEDSEIIAHSDSEDVLEMDEANPGIGWCATDEWAPVQGLALVGPVAVACGRNHSIIGTRSGELYAWGEGELGQLGTGNFQHQTRPKLCSTLRMSEDHIEAFDVGGNFAVMIAYDGSRGEAKLQQLAEKYADIWLRKVHKRGLGEVPKLSKEEAVNAMDDMMN